MGNIILRVKKKEKMVETGTEFESVNYPYRKWDILPKVEGVKAIPTDGKSKNHILYQTTSQSYGQIAATKLELPVERHPLRQTISKYQGTSLGHRSGYLNNSRSPNPLGEDGMYSAAAARVKHQQYTKR